MKKSLIAFALLAAASLAMAFTASPPGHAVSTTGVAPLSVSVPQVSRVTGVEVTDVARVAPAERAGLKHASVHPGAGERETHPTFAPVSGAGGYSAATLATYMRAWPSGQAAAFQAAQVGSIPTARSTGST